MTKPLIVANWKMSMRHNDALTFAQQANTLSPQADIVLCPSFPDIYPLQNILKAVPVSLGAQDCSEHEKGAYTGQVSAFMLKDAECTYCIVGHSERRHGLDESHETITQKVLRLVEVSLTPIICIGETLEERESGQTNAILKAQLAPIVTALSGHTVSELALAYEPVWAIGTGKVPDQASLAQTIASLHEHIQSTCKISKLRLLYGGSINDSNAEIFLQIPHIEGLLVGGASLDFKLFQKIVSLAVRTIA